MDTESCKIIENLLNTTSSWAHGRPVAKIHIELEPIMQTQNHTTQQTILGVGLENPLVLVIGDTLEQKENTPFIEQEMQLLEKMLVAIQLSQNSNTHIASILKCESHPTTEQLQIIISHLNPKMILTVGDFATECLLGNSANIANIHGHFFDFKSIPLMATYAPSVLLKETSYKKVAWDDLKLFKSKLLEFCPHYEQAFNT